MEINNTTYPLNAFRLCIDGLGENLSGFIYTPLAKEPLTFRGMETFLELDILYDKVGYPQSFQDKRSFEKTDEEINIYSGQPDALMKPEDIIYKRGRRATFDVVVQSRCNTTWQGVILRDGTLDEEPFNGDLELWEKIERFA
ncbi:MAG: hypothetical protein IKY04_03400 [Lachnospiraceae bacterium]|nr:hypothetical protein [Lachnospiraceae bacterium]MBR4993274.1 hypothetical protein [Lachnospiraceae bacterium]MBR5943809.1 hypothetical protein [Lachnospiraceae bacterium]